MSQHVQLISISCCNNSANDAGSKGQQCEVVGVGCHVKNQDWRWDSLTQNGKRGLGSWQIPVGPPPAPGGKASGAVSRGMRPSCRRGRSQAI